MTFTRGVNGGYQVCTTLGGTDLLIRATFVTWFEADDYASQFNDYHPLCNCQIG